MYTEKFIGIYFLLFVFKLKNNYNHSILCSQQYVQMSRLLLNNVLALCLEIKILKVINSPR